MKNKKFAYLFPLGGKIVWSFDTPTTLLTRGENDGNLTIKIADFVNTAQAGNYMILPTGEVIFCTIS